MRVCAFGTYDVGSHPRVGILIEGLRARGHDVITCNEPLGVDTAGRIDAVNSVAGAFTLARRLLGSWSRLLRASRRLGPVDAVLVGYLGVFDVVLARLRWPRTPLVLDHLAPVSGTGADRRLGGPIRQWLLRAVDAAAETAADVVVVDTDEHAEGLPRGRRDRRVVVPVGASTSWFREPQPHPTPPLRVVFFGLYTPLQGAPVIGEALARLFADGVQIEATMIGSGQELGETRARAGEVGRIVWRSWVAPERLPEVVAAHDVCLGIFGTTPKAARVVPNKVFQGAAAGCVVVTRDSPPQRRLLTAGARFVAPGDAAELALVLRELAADPGATWDARRAAHRLAQDRFQPQAVAAPLADYLSRLDGQD